jgi:biotin synthase
VGDYLTTQGQTARDDLRMIEDAGFVLETPDGAPLVGDPFDGVPESYPRAALPLMTV